MFRKRRKFKGVWLPPDPHNTIAGQQTQGLIATPSANAIKNQLLNLPNAEGFGSSESYPLVGDLEEDRIVGESVADTVALSRFQFNTLNDLSFGYSLHRVVGKLFVNVEQNNVADLAASVWCITAGIIVRKVDEDGLPQDSDPFTDSYESERDPWLWRRNWVLQNSGATPGAGIYTGQIYPAGNWQYGSIQDGPHVDQKTRRTVKSEERLFLDVSAIALDGSEEQTSTACALIWDFRFFGRVFQSAGNRHNASR